MTAAEFDTRRRMLGLSLKELGDLGQASEKAAARWASGARPIPADLIDAIEGLEDDMQAMVDQMVASVTHRSSGDPWPLYRYRTKEELDESPHACGLPLGAHAVLVGWQADALEAEGIETRIEWAGMVD